MSSRQSGACVPHIHRDAFKSALEDRWPQQGYMYKWNDVYVCVWDDSYFL